MAALKYSTIFLLLLFTGCSSSRNGESELNKATSVKLKSLAVSPPASLDVFYPPAAQQPVYLFKMFEMNSSLTGVMLNIFEGDMSNLHVSLNRFEEVYREVSKMIPEWEYYYNNEAVKELNTAVSSGSKDGITSAINKITETCSNCHTMEMSNVQHKYHWGDFSSIGSDDPVTGKEISFKELMRNLAFSFTATEIKLKEARPDKALTHFENFRKRFEAMEETCSGCHNTERKYYVDTEVRAIIENLGNVLKSSTPDMKAAGELLQGIGMESCFKCHLVHDPAALTKAKWEFLEREMN